MQDEDALTTYMETDDLPAETIYAQLREATVAGQVQPVLCGASLNYIGVQPLLDAVVHYLRLPLDRPPVTGTNPNPKKPIPRFARRLTRSPSVGLCSRLWRMLMANCASCGFTRED